MRIYDNGVYRDMTADEASAVQAEPTPEATQTPEDQIAELRAVVAKMMTALEAIV